MQSEGSKWTGHFLLKRVQNRQRSVESLEIASDASAPYGARSKYSLKQ